MRIVIACGGTGGHIYPGLTLGQALQAQGAEVLFMGSSTRMEKDKIPAAGFSFVGLPIRPFNKKNPLGSAWNWSQCTRQAIQIFKQQRPDALVGLGSYITVPALLAAKQLGIPIFLIETNMMPGKANQMLGRLAQWVALAYAETAKAFPHTPTHVTGSPVRPEFGSVSRETGAQAFGVNPQNRVISLIGGSQGAQVLNQALLDNLSQLLSQENLEVVHVCGASNYDQIREAARSYASHPRYHLLNYVENMPALLATSDLAISRAGASMIAELMVCEVPVILVPGRFGGGHQRDNALAVENAGAGLMCSEDQLAAPAFAQLVQDVISNTERLDEMRQNCKQLNTASATEQIVALIQNSLKLSQKEAVAHA